jgi:hypothetical protein
MPPYLSKVIIVEDHSAAIVAELARHAAELRHETAWRILTSAQANAPKQTESLSVSAYLVDEYGSTYAAAASAAEGKSPGVALVTEVPAEADTTIIAWAVEHAETAEYYTGPINPGAHPFFTPAIEAERPGFDADVARLMDGLT